MQGLCNGTRLQVKRVSQRVLECKFIGGRRPGSPVMLPRMRLDSAGSGNRYGVDFRRTQFPVRLAFALTIDKAQGQSLDHVGLCLDPEVFSHGQLYVALSRTTNAANIRLVVPGNDDARRGWLRNVVYGEAFQNNPQDTLD